MILRTFGVAVAVFSLLTVVVVGDVRAGSTLTHDFPDQETLLNVSSPEGGYLRETHRVALERGTNTLRVSLGEARYVPTSLLLVPHSPGIRVRQVSVIDRRTALWTLESQIETIAEVDIMTRLNGFRNESSYRIDLKKDTGELKFQETLKLRNKSGLSFEGTWLGVGYGSWLKGSFKTGDEKEIKIYEKKRVPYSRYYKNDGFRSDPSGESQSLTKYYSFANHPGTRLGDRAIREGKVRFFVTNVDTGSKGDTTVRGDTDVFLEESRIDYVPLGEVVSVPVGRSSDVQLKREVVNRERENIRRNQFDQIQLFDETKTIRFNLKNSLEDTAHVRLVEPIAGEWSINEASMDYRTPSNNRIVFRPDLAPRSTRSIRLTVTHYDVVANGP